MSPVETSLLHQLSTNSVPYHDPLTKLNWSELSLEDFWLPESALSLHGVPEFETLSVTTRKRLSQYEFIHFLQAGMWLEGIFLQRVSKDLINISNEAAYTYSLHEIREEAGHSLMFLKLMEKSGLPLPPLAVKRPRLADFLGRHAPNNSVIFWLAVLIGEEVPDRYNRHVRLSPGGAVNTLIKQMCTLHIIDEARHIAHTRSALETAFKSVGKIHKQFLTVLMKHLMAQFLETFYYPHKQIYDLAGLPTEYNWRELARNPSRHAFVLECVGPTLRFLAERGININPGVKPRY